MSALRRIRIIPSKRPAHNQRDRLFSLMRLGGIVLGALVSAWLVFLSFPKASHAGLAWIALVPFLLGISKIRGFWSSFFYGWFTAFLFHAGLFYWIYYTCVHGGGLSPILSLGAWWGLCAVLSLQFACFGGSCYFLKKAGCFFPLLAACAFVTLEWLHQTIAFYGLGFPWLMWGYTQWNVPALLQIASYAGVYGISFMIILVNGLGALAFAKGIRKASIGYLLTAVAIFLGLYIFGSHRLPVSGMKSGADFKPLLNVEAALMQPNIDQYKKWDEQFEQEITNTLWQLGSRLENERVMLTVWPESVLPGELADERYANLIRNILTVSGSYQILGAAINQGGQRYVGAYLIEPDGLLQSYRKIKLVPFGEYLPAGKLLRRVLPQADIMGENGEFIPGSADQPLLNAGGVALGTTICYEAIFPQVWHLQNKQGAKLFVNLTNDAWFFDTAAPYQHIAANVLRAVENNRFVLRAANTGFSAVIDPFGRVLQKSDLFALDLLRASVPLQISNTKNLYTRWGDWFAWLCVIVFISALIPFVVFGYD